MGFTIILQSYLGYYMNCASDREMKLRRAIQSVIDQTYKDWELIIISDGCSKTVDIAKEFTHKGIRGFLIPKQKIWTGMGRNFGIHKSSKKYIMYLDSDDMYIPTYLEQLSKKVNNRDWYFVDDIIWSEDKFIQRKCNPDVLTFCGTSNIIHKKLGIWWADRSTYLHDWDFIQRLKTIKDYKKLNIAGYKVMHVPKQYDI